MDTVGLINPSSKRANYQGLDTLSAVMPPHWLAVRASYHYMRDREVIVNDCAVKELNPNHFKKCTKIEIMPSGVHPHAFIHEQAGVEAVVEKLKPLNKPVEIIMQLPFNPSYYLPKWDYFNLNKYYAHNWHTWGQKSRNPYGTLATSVSCPYSCTFCNIKNYYGCKYKEYERIEISRALFALNKRNVKNIKMMDEIFIYKRSRTEMFCDLILGEGYDDLNIWGYARVDTIDYKLLPKMKKAGINWICIGIESGNQRIRTNMNKGSFTNDKVKDVVKSLKDNGISVLGNYMFGFPEDTVDTMFETLYLAQKLNCEYSNFYCMSAYPNTDMEELAKDKGWQLPTTYSGYSQYSADFQPLPTNYLKAKDVLAFRDWAWYFYHSSGTYQSMMKEKYGITVVNQIKKMLDIPLHRNLLNGSIVNGQNN